MSKTLFETEVEQNIKKNKAIKKLKIGATTIGLATFLGVTGYFINKSNENTKFTYVSDENNDFKAEGKVKYDEVSNWYLVEKELLNGETKLFICDSDFGNKPVEVTTGIEIAELLSTNYDGSTKTYYYIDDSVVNVKQLDEYLITYDMVKAYYTIDDIEKLLSLIEKDYDYNSNKELSK